MKHVFVVSFFLLNVFMGMVSLLLNRNALGFDFLSGCGLLYFVRMVEVFDAITSHIGKRRHNY